MNSVQWSKSAASDVSTAHDTDVNISSGSSTEDDYEDYHSNRGISRFGGRNGQDGISHRRSIENNTISRYSRESLYSYSFSALPPSASQCAKNRKRFIMRQGIDFVKRVRSQLEDRTTRRFSNPDLGEAPNWRPGYWSSYNTPRTSIDLDSSSIRDFLAGSDKRQNSRRSSMEWTSLTPIYEIDNNTRASNAMPPVPETTPSYYSRALHVPTRFLPQNQAILTSDIKGSILLFNDIASLCFRIDRSYIGRSILDMIDVSFHKQINKVMKRNDILHEMTHTKDSKDSVLMCGVVVPIIRVNGEKSAASLWLKEKKKDGGGFVYIWIFEEIHESALSAYLDENGSITKVVGNISDLYGYDEKQVIGKPISMLIPALQVANETSIDLHAVERFKFFGSRTKSGAFFPVMTTLHKGNDNKNIIKITSLPTIAGMITVHDNGVIQSISPVPAKYLFGYQQSEDITETMKISEFLPQLPDIIRELRRKGLLEDSNAVLGTNACKHALADANSQLYNFQRNNSRPQGQEYPELYAIHRDQSKFPVQLQLRLIESMEENLVSVWVAFDRILSQTSGASLTRNKEVASISSDGPPDPANPVTPSTASTESRSSTEQLTTSRRSNRSMVRRWVDFPNQLQQSEPAPSCPQLSANVPKVLEEYVIEGVLGEGAYGVAKLAYRRDDESKVECLDSLKWITKSRIVVDSWMRDRRFGDIVPSEIHILRTLQQHPHVNCCKLLTFMEDDDCYYAVTALHGEGMDLFDYIEVNENITEQEAKAIFRQVAEAVRHLHSLKIVHRDIKDENIILDETCTALLIDFGSAAYFRPGKKFDTFSGTLDYWAPELLQGISYTGPPQDIWSLGILLHTLIFRETPFYQLDDILEGDLHIRELPYPGPARLLHSMLSRDVDKRPTIEQVLADPWLSSN